VTTVVLYDTNNEVAMLTNAVFDDLCSGAVACVVPTFYVSPGCGRGGYDLLIREDPDTMEWGDHPATREERDINGNFETYSLVAVLIHEWGHVLGFDHDPWNSSVMGGSTLAATMGGRSSISEHEYDAMTSIRPHTSTGNNLSLAKIMPTGTVNSTNGLEHAEVWDNESDAYEPDWEAFWRLCEGAAPVDPATVIEPIFAMHLGTSSLNNVQVNFRLKAVWAQDCVGNGTYLLDVRTMGPLNSNTPYEILPDTNLDVPAGAGPGSYTVCAKIDPLDVVAESDNTDNVIESERLLAIIGEDDPNYDDLCP
jgi:hypothetical protein